MQVTIIDHLTDDQDPMTFSGDIFEVEQQLRERFPFLDFIPVGHLRACIDTLSRRYGYEVDVEGLEEAPRIPPKPHSENVHFDPWPREIDELP